MQEDDGDIEEWARQLRDKASSKHAPAQTNALRSAIAAGDRAASDAVTSDRVAHARLIKHLQKEGLLSDAQARAPQAHDLETRSIRRLGEPGLPPSSDAPVRTGPNRRWHAWVGAMAAVLVVAFGLRVILLPDPGVRGFVGSVTLSSEQPDATFAEAASQLESLGLKPRRVTEDGRLFLELDVTPQQLETFFKWAEPRGGRPVTPGVYRVFVASKPVASR